MAEDVGPAEAIKRRSSLLKKSWGEQVVGGLSIGLVFGLLVVAAAILGFAAIFSVADTSPAVAIVVILVFALLGIALVNSTLSGIYSAAVYDYAMGGSADELFREDLIKNAFMPMYRI